MLIGRSCVLLPLFHDNENKMSGASDGNDDGGKGLSDKIN